MRFEDVKIGMRIGFGPYEGTVEGFKNEVDVYVKWDYDPEVRWIPCHHIEPLQDSQATEDLTVESAIKFLTSKGFEVTLKTL